MSKRVPGAGLRALRALRAEGGWGRYSYEGEDAGLRYVAALCDAGDALLLVAEAAHEIDGTDPERIDALHDALGELDSAIARHEARRGRSRDAGCTTTVGERNQTRNQTRKRGA